MILLTGGTGFVGRHLLQQFVTDGHPVRVLSRAPSPVVRNPVVFWIEGDLEHPASLRTAVQGIDVVLHAAAVLPGPRTQDGAIERINVGGTESLAIAARDAGVARFVHLSSAGVYGDGAEPAPHREADTPRPGNAYERSKLAAEHVLAAALAGSPVSWTILRPQGLYGADRPATATQFREIAHRRLWVHGPARVAVHPTHVADLVAVVARVLGREDLDGEVINVGGERSLEFSDLIALIGRCIGHAPLQFRAPRWTGHAARIAAHGWSAVGTPPNALTRQARSWINRAVDIDKARRLLGFQPVPLEWGIDQTARALLQNGNL